MMVLVNAEGISKFMLPPRFQLKLDLMLRKAFLCMVALRSTDLKVLYSVHLSGLRTLSPCAVYKRAECKALFEQLGSRLYESTLVHLKLLSWLA